MLLLGATVAVIAAFGWPAARTLDLTRKRGECALHVDAIKRAEEAWYREHNSFVGADWEPREQVDAEAVLWEPGGGFAKLGFEPLVQPVRGAYRIQVVEGGYVVTGHCDVDGDGVLAVYEATHVRDSNATLATPGTW